MCGCNLSSCPECLGGFVPDPPPSYASELCTLCEKAESALALLDKKRELLTSQRAALDEALQATDIELVAARAAVSSFRLALGRPVIPHSLPVGICPSTQLKS